VTAILWNRGAGLGLPGSAPGMRIGLFGGSFNPPHHGHRLVARQTLRRLKLDAVWWLVSPGNPLKDHSELAPLAARVAMARKIIDHPRVRVTGFEAARGFKTSFQTLHFLRNTLADRQFVWIMGADNLASFHLWERWQDIARLVPIAIYTRPGSARTAPFSPAAHALARFRIPEALAPTLAGRQAPAWVFLHGIMSELSSTALRAATATRDHYPQA